jgi:hypothetical protein
VPVRFIRLVRTTSALRLSWIGSMVFCVFFAAVMCSVAGAGDMPFLIIAPIVPVAGVAWSFSRAADPLWDIALATPTGGLRLTLLRSVAVLLTSIVIAGAASVMVPERGWHAVAWLLPGLALTALTLALSTTRLAVETVAILVGGAWLIGVFAVDRVGAGAGVVFAIAGQIVTVVVLIAAGVVVIIRRDTFNAPMRSAVAAAR